MAIYERVTAFGFAPDGQSTYRYFLVGDTTKPVVVLVPGYTGVHSNLYALARHLKHRYCVLIPEWPGWEETPRFSQPLTIRNYALYFKQLLDFLGLKSVTFVAHCVGSAIAIEFALLYPTHVKELFLVSVPYLDGMWIKPIYLGLGKLSKRSPKPFRSLIFLWRSKVLNVPLDFWVIKLHSERKKLARIRGHIFDQSSQSEDAVEEHWISYLKFNFRKVSRLRVPIHFIHGGEDMFVRPYQAEKLKRYAHRATFDILSRAGHVPLVETPGALASIVLGYLHPRRR